MPPKVSSVSLSSGLVGVALAAAGTPVLFNHKRDEGKKGSYASSWSTTTTPPAGPLEGAFSLLPLSLPAPFPFSSPFGSSSSSLQARERRNVDGAWQSANIPAATVAAPIKCRDGTFVLPYVVPSRKKQLERMKKENARFDVLVIGGGCVGAGVALDAAKRGLSTALIEADDFAAGTSGRSTKLIHGGIRYLETAFKKLDPESFNLVMEALEERAHMLHAAPYMNKPLPIMIPIYKWWEVPYMWAGTKVYDLVGRFKTPLSVPPSHFMSAQEAEFNFPMLKTEGLKGAIIYYDGQMNDTRMNLVLALTATQHGAACTNRVQAVGLLKDDEGKVRGATVKDTLTGEQWDVAADVVVNATGCFADSVRKMDQPEVEEIITPAAGVHVMLPDHFSPASMGLIVPHTTDGRVLFFLPWEGGTIIGTTDSESEITMLPSPTAEEVHFIIQESNRFLKTQIKASDAIAAWSGLRPLVRDPTKMAVEGTKALSRNHVVEVSEGNLVTIAGGKWTTYRRMAADTVDAALEAEPSLKERATRLSSTTQDASLIGADRMGIVCDQKFDTINVTLKSEYGFDSNVASHLVSNYGTRALQIAEIVRHDSRYRYSNPQEAGEPRRLVRKYPFLEAEVVFAVEQEYAVKAVDVLARRMRLAFLDAGAAKKAAPRVINIMAGMLGWSRSRQAEELAEVDKFLETMSPKTPPAPSTSSLHHANNASAAV